MASCPLHTDHTPSLSVTWRDKTPPAEAARCCCTASAARRPRRHRRGPRASCCRSLRQPRPASDATQPPDPPPARPPSDPHRPAAPTDHGGPQPAQHQWRQVRVYTYTTADGRPVQQVIRQECGCGGRTHKRFQQRYRHDRRWVYRKPAGFTPGLYRAGAIQAAAKAQTWVCITEGEKDADTLTGLGVLATTNAQGAANFPPALLAQFTGLNVAIVADRDLAGYRRAVTLYQHLHHTAAQVIVLVAGLDSHKADATDHVEAGLWNPDEPFGGLAEVTISDLQALTAAAVAREAADLFAVALAEAQAHQGRQAASAISASAAARWLTEAAHQLNTVRRSHQRLQRHTNEHPAPIAARAATPLQACAPAPKTPGAAEPDTTCTNPYRRHRHDSQRPEGATMTTGLDTIITYRAAAAVTAGTGRPGPAAHTARAWIDSFTARAQLRSERHTRPNPTVIRQ